MIGGKMKLLAIPNDATNAYSRNYEEDFLSEFNPKDEKSKRTFEEVRFLNWKDEKSETQFGIKSQPFLKNKKNAKKIMKELSERKRKFESPLFKNEFLKEINEIENFIKEYNPDMVRAFNTHFAGELGEIIKSRYKIPLVISAHDPSRITSIIEDSDSLVCISQSLKNKCLNEYNIEENKIKVIPDGIDMNFFYPRKNIGKLPVAKYKILSVGRIVPSKNIETLLESIKYLKEEFGKDIKHIHLGKGNDENLKKIETLKHDLGLDETSYFVGGVHKTKLPNYYSWADVYSLPTLWEGLGRAQIESLACGTPVLTTNYEPMTEIVKEGYNGMTYNPKDPKEITEKTIKYFKNKKLRRTMENNARKSVVGKYSLEKVMEMHSKNYKELAKL
jgi:glycosyltransferase involved in cell wall biosynthesis